MTRLALIPLWATLAGGLTLAVVHLYAHIQAALAVLP